MSPNVLSRHPQGSWRGFIVRVAIIALAALIVLGVADWFGISLDPMNRATPRPAPQEQHAPSSTVPEP